MYRVVKRDGTIKDFDINKIPRETLARIRPLPSGRLGASELQRGREQARHAVRRHPHREDGRRRALCASRPCARHDRRCED